jgi:hypothetical protein
MKMKKVSVGTYLSVFPLALTARLYISRSFIILADVVCSEAALPKGFTFGKLLTYPMSTGLS